MSTTTIDEKFVSAVKRMESATMGVSAFVVIDRNEPDRWGRVVISRNGRSGTVRAIAWLPMRQNEDKRHHGYARGGGYDMATASMGGARYTDTQGRACVIADQGTDWRRQLENAGYIVVQAC